jgi:hypothetical protein
MYNFYIFNEVLVDTRDQSNNDFEEYIPAIYRCPLCESDIVVSGRCKTCHNCGWSTCDL